MKLTAKVKGAAIVSYPGRHPEDPQPPLLVVGLDVKGETHRIQVSLSDFRPGTTRQEALDFVWDACIAGAHEIGLNAPSQIKIAAAAMACLSIARKWRWRGAWDCVLGAPAPPN